MNFIKTLKFSVKGIDTTRYILRALARGISLVNSFRVEFRGGSVHFLDLAEKTLRNNTTINVGLFGQ